jgi:ADYC domain-containing protein
MRLVRTSFAVALFLLVGWGQTVLAASPDSGPRIEVSGAKFRIDLGDGRVLQGTDLAGVVLVLRDRANNPLEIRIDSVAAGDAAAAGMELYGLSRRNADGAWSALCKPGADGRALGFPLPSSVPSHDDVEAEGDNFSIACTAGARGKCVMLGYRPWKDGAAGSSLQPYFDACVRMMRADYCGDGRSSTRPGVRVDMWDRAGVQQAQTDLPFEAAWGPNGAVCLARVRVPGVATLESILQFCPRLAAHVGSPCESWSRRSDSGALIWNRSAIGD